jgi:hypothetical protein
MGFDGMTLIVKSSLRETVDRHEISALAMTRGKEVCNLITIHTLSLRGENVNDRRGNPSCPEVHERPVASFSGSQ